MFKNQAILQCTCSLALLAAATLPCAGQQKTGTGTTTTTGKSAPVAPVVSKPAPASAPLNPFNPLNPYAPSSYRPAGGPNILALSGQGYGLQGYSMANFAANQSATNSIIASLTNSPFINQMQQGYLPGSNLANPWVMPNPYMSPFMNPMIMTNPMLNNPFMNPMMNNAYMNPMMTNPFMNPMMNPMMTNPFMNPMMNPMMAGNPFMMNPMMGNPMMMNPGVGNPFMMQPGMLGNGSMPLNQNNFGAPGLFGRGF